MAPINVQMGPVALMGVTMVIGKRFKALKARIQLETTSMVFRKIRPCSRRVMGGTYKWMD